ncbi:hypothetical protein BC629DRAFT_1565208 [Irpex lacteus]|nr:hypothetical protein BC629DRAFT_1565208 [Irpex lacteus]
MTLSLAFFLTLCGKIPVTCVHVKTQHQLSKRLACPERYTDRNAASTCRHTPSHSMMSEAKSRGWHCGKRNSSH